MAIVKRLTKRGFTLIELMIVVVIIGVLASLAIYGVQRYVANSKSAEARIMLGKISKDALTAYEGESMPGTILAAKGVAVSSNIICDTATNLVPTAIATVAGQKYQPDPGEFKTGDADANIGWACLGFSVTTPIYYQYNYTANTDPTASAIVDDGFVAYARGDLDNDGTLSTFSIEGKVQAGTDGGLQMFLAPSFVEVRPEE